MIHEFRHTGTIVFRFENSGVHVWSSFKQDAVSMTKDSKQLFWGCRRFHHLGTV
jgi:hypothetical protein